MERDFLGRGEKDSMVKEEPRGSCKDAVFSSSSAVQRPFPNKMSTLQQFIPFNESQHDWIRKNVFDQFSSSGFQPMSSMGSFDATHRQSSVLLPQKSFGIDGQTVSQFAMPLYPSPVANSYGMTIHHSNINISSDGRMVPVVSNHILPISQSNNFFKGSSSLNGSTSAATSLKQQQNFGGRSGVPAAVVGSVSEGFAPRNLPKPVPQTAQLTIFYGGSVNVYDNVPIEKAQAIISLASNGSSTDTNTVNLRNPAPMLVPGKLIPAEPVTVNQNQPHNNVASPCSGFSSPISVTSHATAHSTSGSSTLDDKRGQKSSTPLVPKTQNEHLKTTIPAVDGVARATLMSRAVPMARKASLARFLEKRKERVTNAAPYSTQKTTEGSMVFEASCLTGKPTTVLDRSIPVTGENSWCLSSTRYSHTDSKPPNTNLKI